MKTKPHTFTVTINDHTEQGISYQYDFVLSDENSIYEIASTIAKNFNVEVPQAKTVKNP